MPQRLTPKIITVLREGYPLHQFTADLLSGLIVGIVALPLAIAFAIASGVEAEKGLYTAVIGGFAAALLGGSRVQVSGPTGAFIVVVYAIVQKYGYEGLALATFMAGILLVLMGFLRMGVLLRYIPYPVTVGFTSGIAVIIFSSQIRDFFGLSLTAVPAPFLEKWILYAHHLGTFNAYALIVGSVSLLLLFLLPKILKKVPSSLVVLILSTVIVSIFHFPIDTIGSRFGSVSHALPHPRMIQLSLESIRELFPSAMTIALLGAIESLLSAVVADSMLGTRHRSNMELVAQGVSNILSPIFSGIPSTGAIARTAVNVRNGGRTPVAAMIHAVVLLLILVQFGQYTQFIPMATLAAILIYVAYNMSEWHTFLQILKCPRSDVAVLISTFLLTVLIDLTVAIEVGVVLSAFLFMKRMESVSEINQIFSGDFEEETDDPNPLLSKEIPKGVEVYEIFGPLFFGVVERFKNSFVKEGTKCKVLILRMRNVPAIDASGMNAINDAVSRSKKENFSLIISSLREQPLIALTRAGIVDKLGKENVLPTIDAALKRAASLIA